MYKGGNMNTKMSELEWAAWIFVIIGALNWASFGLFAFDSVQVVFGTSPLLAKVVYGLIGVSGAYSLAKLFIKK